ncbi:Uncharacterised protein [Nocardiopsis dassonvillei]|uniref:Uncharacterized protein n=1 Tax=Nocardiopsis dassonvillei (strain ATCC 23218 / DSM 43111 / CIP 107115 / JCM 7437 / KCTC 9190 / NBRC 14626 / NCTC 10488 / NRRL B-5397 / IMRU 509) TaxID=446468 RepID=D7AZY3_NOCDD|nr:hypothetical protein Ndas_2843 [Nocardiopsis dassonvillei subsp. dassonvillei DSM 43111]VEI88758.1 Uncharacterised protein [Nocardiopsis dassonvillei]
MPDALTRLTTRDPWWVLAVPLAAVGSAAWTERHAPTTS